MSAPAHHETRFEEIIVSDMTHPLCGWVEGTSKSYDKQLALYPEDLIAYIKTTQPDAYAKYQQRFKDKAGHEICKMVFNHLDKKGALHTLKHEIKAFPAHLRVCQFKPELPNPDTQRKYDANICRVVRQLYYSENNQNSLDLVLFLNGIPVSTIEVKTDFTQSVEDAILQYKNDRLPKDKATKKIEPLLSFNKRALVHFALSNDEVYMTTQLEGQNTFFLPFNKGNHGGKGNPPNPDGYATDYLWKEILTKDSLLNIIAKFIHLEVKKKEDHQGMEKKKETLIFPRFHQLEVVRKLLKTVKSEGAGKKYLIQHSAGSGKSNSIAWLSHQLSSLHDDHGQRIFDTVIVVNDRTVLDDQLSETISNIEHKAGLIVSIDRNHSDFSSKSKQLEQALIKGAAIIPVTIQTFPYVLEAIQNKITLKNKNFAIIADEAHSSQSGKTAGKMREALNVREIDDDEEYNVEDLIADTITARAKANNLSFFAFTATPKQKTVELFGRLPNPYLLPSTENRPEPFHIYTMQQALEEGFILDVLANYITYEMACRIEAKGGQREVDSKQGKLKLKQYIKLHPHNIAQKIDVIITHFSQSIQYLLNGQAKAMVLTSSRKEAVRYKLEFDKYIEKHKENSAICNIQAMVAFSGKVNDDYVGDNKEYTEANMNPKLKGRDMRDAFDTDEYQVMLVANKFQTGFDQPKLCAMYVDKKLSGIDAVQALSRLNRTYPGKDVVFILDFINRPEDIKSAFNPYYKNAQIEDITDPNLAYELYDGLNEYALFTENEIHQYAEAYLKKGNQQNRMSAAVKPAADRFRQQYHQANKAVREAFNALEKAKATHHESDIKKAAARLSEAKQAKGHIELFKKQLRNFIRTYDFLSQIHHFDDIELEKFSLYARGLLPNIHLSEIASPVEIDDVVMTHYRLSKKEAVSINLRGGTIDPIRPGQARGRGSRTELLDALVKQMNELYSGPFTEADFIHFFDAIISKVKEDEKTMEQIKANGKERALEGNLSNSVTHAIVTSLETNTELSSQTLRNPNIHEAIVQRVADRLYQDLAKAENT